MEKKGDSMNNEILEFDIVETKTIRIPSEDEIREYVKKHITELSLIDFARWAVEKSIKWNEANIKNAFEGHDNNTNR